MRFYFFRHDKVVNLMIQVLCSKCKVASLPGFKLFSIYQLLYLIASCLVVLSNSAFLFKVYNWMHLTEFNVIIQILCTVSQR